MKALLLREYKKLEYVDFPDPEYQENEVLIQVKSCGICGSDIHGYDGSSGRRIPPIIMGHEAAGEIVAVGKKATAWKIGDRVTFDSTLYCQTCSYCRQGEINLCDNRQIFGVSCADYRRHGAFAEYLAVPEFVLYRIPDEVGYDQAAMIEPISIAFHSLNLTPLKLNDAAIVVGAGMIGLLVIQALRLAGYGAIIVADIDPSKFRLATEFGADICVVSDPQIIRQAVAEATGGIGASVALDVVGMGNSLQVALAGLKKGGHLTLIGNLTPEVTLPLQQVVTRQICLQGSCASAGEYQACLDMLARKMIKVDPIISKFAALSEGAVWFDRLYRRQESLLKVILKP